jgi:mRNA interferase MazF
VDLDSIRSQEIQKTRSVIVISTDLFAPIPLRTVIPITTWQDKFNRRPFMVKLPATEINGLARDSAANVLQVCGLLTQRFVKRLGQIKPDVMTEILAGLVICMDYEGTP